MDLIIGFLPTKEKGECCGALRGNNVCMGHNIYNYVRFFPLPPTNRVSPALFTTRLSEVNLYLDVSCMQVHVLLWCFESRPVHDVFAGFKLDVFRFSVDR